MTVDKRDGCVVSFVDDALGNSSYLVDCGEGVALIVDPVRDIGPYFVEAQKRNLRIAFALETHLHADFISGSHALAGAGVEILAPAGSELAFEHRALQPGDELRIGDITVRTIATPGHTPEHLVYVISMNDTAFGMFSGGALLPGTVARTDLITPEQTETLTRSLYRSIHASIAPLPDELPVYPTHGGGSFCAASKTKERTTTVGRERATNPVFVSDEDEFVKELLAGFGTYPSYFLRLRDLNRLGSRVFAEPPLLRRLPIDEARDLIKNGAQVIDARAVTAWAAGHIPGSLSIELRSAFASWLGWLVDPNTPIVFVLDDDQDRTELVRECLKIGYENLAGEIDGGFEAWRNEGFQEAKTETVKIEDVASDVLDVRQDNEYVWGHLPGAIHLELGSFTDRSKTLPPKPLAVMCGHGERAATAVSLLERVGRIDTRLIIGGPDDWSRFTGKQLQIDT